jgi:hypothetical protein
MILALGTRQPIDAWERAAFFLSKGIDIQPRGKNSL